MLNAQKFRKTIFAIAVVIIILLNVYTLLLAVPTMDKPLDLGSGVLPRDFSVYYMAGYRLLHNSPQMFSTQPLDNTGPAIYPYLTPYKYLPSFAILISPLTSLGYYQAFWIFDALQFIMLPLIAFMLYRLLENKHWAVGLAILVLVLVMPYPMAGRGLSVSYFMQWAEGQAKVLEAFLLLLSFYLGFKGKAMLSGVTFALLAFDPRYALLGLPLFLFYNKEKLKSSFAFLFGTLALSNVVFLLPGVASGFVGIIFGSDYAEPFWTPAWIPLALILCLLVINTQAMVRHIKIRFPVLGKKTSV